MQKYRPFTRSGDYFTKLLLLLLLLTIISILFPDRSPLLVRARTPDAEILAVGDWNVKIRCGKEFYSSLLFPPTRVKADIEPTGAPNRLLPKLWPPPFPPQEFSCQLSLYPNGTFTMQPNNKKSAALLGYSPQDQEKGSSTNNVPTTSTAADRLLLRGRWRVQANPYCITDRFYDQLYLESYPRKLVTKRQQRFPQSSSASALTPTTTSRSNPLAFMAQRIIPGRRTSSNKNDDSEQVHLWHRLSLQMNCRMCGRYASPGPWRLLQGRNWETKARLTHGTLLWKHTSKKHTSSSTILRRGKQQQQLQGPSLRQGQHQRYNVGASFSGNRLVRQRVPCKYQEEQELRYFGY